MIINESAVARGKIGKSKQKQKSLLASLAIFDVINSDFFLFKDTILKEISPMDLRMLIKAEEELSQTNGFSRLFPSAKSHQYFKYFYRDGIPYYDRLLDAWEHKYAHNRAKGIRTLRKYCNKAIHL